MHTIASLQTRALLVEARGTISTLAAFAADNAPEVLQVLIGAPLGLGVRCPIGGGLSDPFRLVEHLPRSGETARNTWWTASDSRYVCPCGNGPDGDGHALCDPQGTDWHPAQGPCADPHLRCARCWRIFRLIDGPGDLPVVGRVAPRACAHPACVGAGCDPVTAETCAHCGGRWTSPEDDRIAAEDDRYVDAAAAHLGFDEAARSGELAGVYGG